MLRIHLLGQEAKYCNSYIVKYMLYPGLFRHLSWNNETIKLLST